MNPDLAALAQLDDAALAVVERELVGALDDSLSGDLHEYLYQDEDTVWAGPDLMGGLVARGQVLHARVKYQKHLEFFRVGANYRERCFMAANRVGKTFGGGAFELSCHLTGAYPAWWEGRRFHGPVSCWAAGRSYETTRDIMQLALLGQVASAGSRKTVDGTGIIPRWAVGQPRWRSGVQDLVDSVPIGRIDGGVSTLGFKSYDQGAKSFEGTARHVIWLDEEPRPEVYGECLIRTATVDGLVMLTFTPLEGMSEVVMQFMPKDQRPDEE